MNLARVFPVIAFIGAAVTAPQALAQVQYAAKTGVGIIAPCPSFCGGPGGRFLFDTDGGTNVTNSYSSASNADGNGQAEATLTGPSSLPVLRAEAYSIGSSEVSAEAGTLQGFYVGPGGLLDYTLEVVLTGQATRSAIATVAIFRDTDPTSDFFYTSDAATMFFEVIPLTGDLELVDRITVDLLADGTPQTATGTITVTDLQAGDLFYVWATLIATGRNGTYGDAYNTVNMAFTDPTGLSQTAPIPEPGTWALLAAGLGLTGWAARRRRG